MMRCNTMLGFAHRYPRDIALFVDFFAAEILALPIVSRVIWALLAHDRHYQRSVACSA